MKKRLPMRSALIALCAVIISGCNMYWHKPGATLEQFAADHRACLSRGEPIPDKPGYVIVDQGTFRTCLAVRGWHREKHNVQDVPPGRFRGVEDFDRLQPIAVDRLPPQPGWHEVSYCGRLGPNATAEQRARCR